MSGQRPSAANDTLAQGRLQARPARQPDLRAQTGRVTLPLAGERAGLCFVPDTYRPDQPAPLVVFLHGASGKAEHSLRIMQPLADAAGLIVLAPASQGRTWDVIEGGYGPDVALVDQALNYLFTHYAIDPAHLAIGGFSDGASYALSLGLANADLFSHIVAFSPGFMAPALREGAPRIYISHGTHDNVLPIDRCSRRIVPQLRRAGYDVRYHEFDGAHTIPAAIGIEATGWFAGHDDPGSSGADST